VFHQHPADDEVRGSGIHLDKCLNCALGFSEIAGKMTEVFVICNQQGHFWGKSKDWVDGSDPKAVLRTTHRDQASNTLFELSSKDFELRGEILPAEVNSKGNPIVTVSDIPLPEKPQEELPLTEESEVDEGAVSSDGEVPGNPSAQDVAQEES